MQFINDALNAIRVFFSDTTNIFLTLVLAIALLAAFATIAAFKSSKQAKKALRGGMLNDLLDSRYTEKHIVARKNLENYCDTCRKHGFDYVKTFVNNRNTRKVEKEIDKSRQIVFAYFDKIYRLRKSKLLKAGDLKRLIDKPELELFMDRCWPLAAGLLKSRGDTVSPGQSGYGEWEVFRFYRKLYNTHS